MDFLKLLNQQSFIVDYTVLDNRKWDTGFYYKIKAIIIDNSNFFASEYQDTLSREYSFHWQSPDNELIIRWDNAPHHKSLATFPHHKHLPDTIEESQEMTLQEALKFIENEIRI